MHGADPNATDTQGYTPLFYAVLNRQDCSQRLLALKGANVNIFAHDGTTPLTHAVRKNDLSQVEFLLWLGAAIRPEGAAKGKSPMELAQASGREDLVRLLTDYGALTPQGGVSGQRQVPGFVKNSLQSAAQRGDYNLLQDMVWMNLLRDMKRPGL
jgi:ankyrin repeat protein